MKKAIIILAVIQTLVIIFLLLTFFGVISTDTPVLVVQDHTEELESLQGEIEAINGQLTENTDLISAFRENMSHAKIILEWE